MTTPIIITTAITVDQEALDSLAGSSIERYPNRHQPMAPTVQSCSTAPGTPLSHGRCHIKSD
jgi:hypothetical protein